MSPLVEFLTAVLREGRAVFRGRPEPAAAPDREALALLEDAYAGNRLRVAGPPVAFDPRAALTAAALLYHACWFLVSRAEMVIAERPLGERRKTGNRRGE